MRVAGEISVPGDKSITHRALLLAGLAEGDSLVRGALASDDARSTARFLRAFGLAVSPLRDGAPVRVSGRRWRSPGRVVHCGNSGTTARLGLGLIAGQPLRATLTGDRSLRRRPMRRVTEPLAQMGARFAPPDADTLPITVRGGRLAPIRWALPASSAQLKSALLLAGLVAGVGVAVREPNGRSRDHTERLLRGLGQTVAERGGWIELRPGATPLAPFEFDVPGDLSSAAFLVGAAVLAEAGELVIRDVGLNPTRTGFLDVLARMGGAVSPVIESASGGEPRGHLVVRPAALRGTVVTAGEIPGLIDEIPMLAVLAARAAGETRFEEVGELRVKESDRLGLLARNLRALGCEAEARANTLVVGGSHRPPRGSVRTEGDHRLAMAFAVLGTVPGARVRIDDRACVAVSYPRFFADLERIRG